MHTQQSLEETTSWDNTLVVPKLQIWEENPVPDRSHSGRTKQVCKAESLKQTFRNVHLNSLPIKLLISQSWGYSPGQETQQTAFHNTLAPQAKMALNMRAVAAVAYVRRAPTAHRGGNNSLLWYLSTGTINAVGLLLVTPAKGTSFSAGLHENNIKFTVKLSAAAAADFAWPLIHLPR